MPSSTSVVSRNYKAMTYDLHTANNCGPFDEQLEFSRMCTAFKTVLP